jgi:hypothetical protein
VNLSIAIDIKEDLIRLCDQLQRDWQPGEHSAVMNDLGKQRNIVETCRQLVDKLGTQSENFAVIDPQGILPFLDTNLRRFCKTAIGFFEDGVTERRYQNIDTTVRDMIVNSNDEFAFVLMQNLTTLAGEAKTAFLNGSAPKEEQQLSLPKVPRDL